jgi:hypothetical protein
VIDPGNHLGVVDLGQVSRVEVGEKMLFSLAIDLGMPAADAIGIEDNMAMLGRPADDDPICPAVSPLARFKNAMPVDSPPTIRGPGPSLYSNA